MSFTVAIFRRKHLGFPPRRHEAKLSALVDLDNATDDKSCLNPELEMMYKDLIAIFPPMNGPDAHEDDNADNTIDYCFLPEVIFADMGYSQSEEFWTAIAPLLKKYRCALCDCGYHDLYWPGMPFWMRSSNSSHKIRKYLIPARDTVLLFVICMVTSQILRWLNHLSNLNGYSLSVYFVDIGSISTKCWVIISAILSSCRIWAEIFRKQ
ncbi:MAG: hypothetical protein NC308_09465 [Clostridium sp.]|nr:hypothetical protein [Bacteroides sp.]MCM1199105.1 hypothetical protein [Clostridium sp.]